MILGEYGGGAEREMQLTVRPCILLAGELLKEETSRTLEHDIALERCDAFELRAYRIEDSRVVRGTLGDILRVQPHSVVDG